MFQNPDVPKVSTDAPVAGVDTDEGVQIQEPPEGTPAELTRALESTEAPVSVEMKLALRLQKEGYITSEQVETLKGMKSFDRMIYLFGYATLYRNMKKIGAKEGKLTPGEKVTTGVAAMLRLNNVGLLDQIVDRFDLSNIEGEGRPNVPKAVPHPAEELLRKEVFGNSGLEYLGISLDELDTPDSTEHKE